MSHHLECLATLKLSSGSLFGPNPRVSVLSQNDSGSRSVRPTIKANIPTRIHVKLNYYAQVYEDVLSSPWKPCSLSGGSLKKPFHKTLDHSPHYGSEIGQIDRTIDRNIVGNYFH